MGDVEPRALTNNESSNWFNDAAKPVATYGDYTISSSGASTSSSTSKLHRLRNLWGTSRSYAPVVTSDASSRQLYDGHVDVSDQFTTFGKSLIGFMYFLFWVLLMFPDYIIPLGRPAIALGGGMLTICIRYVLYKTNQGPVFHAENVIIMEPLFLLFGLMLTTISLERMESGGMFDKIRGSLDDPINYKRVLKILFIASVGSAAVMNDSVVLIFSGVVIDLCVRHKSTNSTPYLLALATACNIGSALTMTGNPQNILIVSLMYDEIKWLSFASNMVLPVVAGSLVNAAAMLLFYRQELFPGTSGVCEASGILFSGRKTPEMLNLERAFYARKAAADLAAAAAADVNNVDDGSWTLWSKIQVVVVIAFLTCFAAGLDVSVVCISSGIVLMTVTAWKRQRFDAKELPRDPITNEIVEPKKTYDLDGNEIETKDDDDEMITESETTLTEVDYGLLLLFIGQFILIGSFDDTGLPQAFFKVTMGECANNMTGGSCVYWFVTVIAILSNICSSAPVCQMLAATFPRYPLRVDAGPSKVSPFFPQTNK